MSRLALWLLVPALVTAAPFDAAADDTPQESGLRLVFFAPGRPLLVALRLQVDGTPLEEVRRAYADQLFDSLDRNGDGRLAGSEAERIPTRAELGGRGNAAPDRSEIDRDPRDGHVSREEWTRYVLAQIGSPLDMVLKPLTPAQSVDLPGRLDTSGDGRLAPAEMTAAGQVLRRFDLDQDESFSLAELAPLTPTLEGTLVPGTRAMEEDGSDVPLRLVPDRDPPNALIDELQKRYGRPEASSAGLDRAQLGLEPERFAALDRNADGRLDAGELTEFLRSPPQMQWVVELPHRKPIRAKVRAEAGPGFAPEHVEQPRGSELTLTLAGAAVELKARVPLTTAYDARQLYRLRFRTADADGNKYLDESEFSGLDLRGADFASVDRDGDGMIFDRELVAYIDRQAERSRNQVALTISREGQSLFEILDENGDRRLTPRELLTAPDRIAALDATGDGLLAEGELAGLYRLSFEPANTRLLEFENTSGLSMSAGAPVRLGGTAGPEWFRRMDYNRDGDLTPREFLGPPADFARLDADADGLLSPDEAEQASAD